MANPHAYAIFSAQYAPHTGGVESFTQRLAHELVRQGNEVHVVTSWQEGAPARERQEDGVEVHRLPSRPLLGGRFPVPRKNAQYGKMLDELAHLGIDRVLVNTRFYPHSLEGVRLANVLEVPVVVLDHGSAHLTFGNRQLDWFVRRYEHAVTRRVRALGPAFAGISHASAEWLSHFDIDTSTVIPNAIDVDHFRKSASSRDFREELALDPGQKLVAFAGRLEPEKGALEFAQAAALAGRGYVFAMAGDGSQRKAIAGLGIDNVRLLGMLAQDDLSALLRDSDLFCLPTRSEGFCTSLLEASAQGSLPVMPHVGGVDEVMGWDPVRFGVALEDRSPAGIALAVSSACDLPTGQPDELVAHVRAERSWKRTVEALEAAFDALAEA